MKKKWYDIYYVHGKTRAYRLAYKTRTIEPIYGTKVEMQRLCRKWNHNAGDGRYVAVAM